MRILIDGDACPQKEDILDISRKYHKEVLIFIDYAHDVDSTLYDEVIYCDVGHDSADMMIVSRIQKNDLLITQDYGLASLVLAKGAKVLHVSGMIIDSGNIDELLFRRYGSAKLRKANQRLKGPKARDIETKQLFISRLEYILKENLE